MIDETRLASDLAATQAALERVRLRLQELERESAKQRHIVDIVADELATRQRDSAIVDIGGDVGAVARRVGRRPERRWLTWPIVTADAERPEIVEHAASPDTGSDEPANEVIEQPAKIMRIGGMIRQLLEEVRNAELDERSRDRMRDIYEMSVNELGTTLSPDLPRGTGPADDAIQRAGGALRCGTAGGPGPARRLVGGVVPGYSGHDVRPADDGPPAARTDAAVCRPAQASPACRVVTWAVPAAATTAPAPTCSSGSEPHGDRPSRWPGAGSPPGSGPFRILAPTR